MSDKAEALVRRADAIIARRQVAEKEQLQLTDYVLPRKSVILRGLVPGAATGLKLYSSAAIKANADLASAMQASLTNAAVRWFSLKFPFQELNEEPEAAEWLDTVGTAMFVAIQQSNFDAEINEAYLDLGAIGTSCTFVDMDDLLRLRHRTLTIGEYGISENARNIVDTVVRQYQMSVRAMKQQWGAERLSEKANKLLQDNKLDATLSILHMVGPRELEDTNPKQEANPLKRKFADFYIEQASKHIIDEGGFFENPYLAPRWSKNSGEEWGRGPGHTALPDIKTLNRARQLKFRQWAKTIDPPMEVVEEGMIGQISLTPSSLNFVRELKSIAPIETATRFDPSSINEGELIQSIKEVFFSDLVNLPPVQGTPMSATEAAQRFELMERKLGPTIGRLKSELLNPYIDRVFGLMQRARLFPDVPGVVQEFFPARGIVEIQVEFEGPLEKAQKQTDLIAIERTYAAGSVIAAVQPQALDVLDHDALMKKSARAAGIGENMILSEERVAAIREQRAKADEQRLQVEQADKIARAAKSGAGAVKTLKDAGIEPPEQEAE